MYINYSMYSAWMNGVVLRGPTKLLLYICCYNASKVYSKTHLQGGYVQLVVHYNRAFKQLSNQLKSLKQWILWGLSCCARVEGHLGCFPSFVACPSTRCQTMTRRGTKQLQGDYLTEYVTNKGADIYPPSTHQWKQTSLHSQQQTNL